MYPIHLVLYVFALVCFVLAASGVAASRFNLVAAGLAALTLSVIF